jgi:hypothetical protein
METQFPFLMTEPGCGVLTTTSPVTYGNEGEYACVPKSGGNLGERSDFTTHRPALLMHRLAASREQSSSLIDATGIKPVPELDADPAERRSRGEPPNRAGLDDSVLAHYLTEQLFNRLV